MQVGQLHKLQQGCCRCQSSTCGRVTVPWEGNRWSCGVVLSNKKLPRRRRRGLHTVKNDQLVRFEQAWQGLLCDLRRDVDQQNQETTLTTFRENSCSHPRAAPRSVWGCRHAIGAIIQGEVVIDRQFPLG